MIVNEVKKAKTNLYATCLLIKILKIGIIA